MGISFSLPSTTSSSHEYVPLRRINEDRNDASNTDYTSIRVEQPAPWPPSQLPALRDNPRYGFHHGTARTIGTTVGLALGLTYEYLAGNMDDVPGVVATTTGWTLAGYLTANLNKKLHMHNKERLLKPYQKEARRQLDLMPSEIANRHPTGWRVFSGWVDRLVTLDSAEFATRPKYVWDNVEKIFEAVKNQPDSRKKIFDLAVCYGKDGAAVALCEMVKELRHAELATNASTEEFIRHAKTAFHDHALHAVAKKIADEIFPEDDGAKTELYAHFSSALVSDLGLTDVVAHQKHARKYGDNAQYGGYTKEKVKELVLETVRKDGAFEAFLCSGDWPHWESHVAHQNQEHFAQ